MTMTTTIVEASLAGVDQEGKKQRKLPVLSVAKLLDAQQTLTAVERFAKKHDAEDFPKNKKYYQDLIPLERPKPGEQYAFQVDLDVCTGCKACVTACHSLNGLDESETLAHDRSVAWRTAQRTRPANGDHLVPSLPRARVPLGLSDPGLRERSDHGHRQAPG